MMIKFEFVLKRWEKDIKILEVKTIDNRTLSGFNYKNFQKWHPTYMKFMKKQIWRAIK